jgi:ubiquitin-protein ligase E3 C
MFSTFTGNSRRPRNVNLSGQAGNPFANTAWSPSAASNATKTVTDAQAEREKRQAERQRQKAASNIQRLWRGHKTRRQVADSRRAKFDGLYHSPDAIDPTQRCSAALPLLFSFCKPQNPDDISRAFLFVNSCIEAGLGNVFANLQPKTLRRLVDLLAKIFKNTVLNRCGATAAGV